MENNSLENIQNFTYSIKNKLKYYEDLTFDFFKKIPNSINRIEVRSVFGWTDVPEEKNTLKEKKKTFSQQENLPRLPIPPLKETCEKYIETIEPLLSVEEFENSKKIIKKFYEPHGVGEKLQKLLEEYNNLEVPSWLEKFWDDSYLYGRDSIAINVNYFFVFEDDPNPNKNTQIGRAASLLRGAVIFKQQLDHEELEPDMERGKPLCMSQYPRIFCSTRIPGEKRDSLITYTKYCPTGISSYSQTTNYINCSPSHVIVMYRNHFFYFDIYENDKILPLTDIESYFYQILQIVNNLGENEINEIPVGVLTAQNRTEWAKQRKKLIDLDPINIETLEKIQSALLIVCLDTVAPNNLDELSRIMLHGPSTNRWFDKHQLIITHNGKAGMLFEHAVGDGSSTLRLADEMYKYSVQNGNIITGNKKVIPKKLIFKLSSTLEEEIKKGYHIFREQILANQTSTLIFTKFGGQFIKENNLSPDAFVQMAIQLAYYKMFGRCDATYESASTKQFLHGRTETVRSVSKASLAFVKSTKESIFSSNYHQQISNQLFLMKEAINSHVKYMREAKDGKGIDRHLFALKMLYEKHQEEFGNQIPEIFTDIAYTKSSKWKISTSHCGASSLKLFGFGPVVPDGFGIGYMIKNNSISFNITSKHTYSEHSSIIFSILLEESLLNMQAILFSSPEKLQAPSISLNFTHPTVTSEFSYFEKNI